MSDERPERLEGEGPRDQDTPAPDETGADTSVPAEPPVEPVVEEAEEIDLGEPAPRRVSRITAAMQAAGQDRGDEVDAAPEPEPEPEPEPVAVDEVDEVDDEPAAEPDELDDEPAESDDHTIVAPAVSEVRAEPEPDEPAADEPETDTDDDEPEAEELEEPVADGEPERDAWPFGAAGTAVAAAAAAPIGDGGGPQPPTDGESGDGRKKRRRWPILLGAAVVLGALYVAGWFLTGTRLPGDVTVAGVQVGGMSKAEARQALDDELTPREDEPVRLVFGDETFDVAPDDAGLVLDLEGSVDQAGGSRSWDPRDMLALFAGSSDHPAALDVDDAALDSAVAAIAETVDVPVTEALITFPEAKPKPREPKDGRVVRKGDTAQLIQDEYLVQDEPAEVPVADETPVVDSEGLAQAVTEIGEPAVAAPVTIQVGEEDVELPVTAFAPALTVEPVDGAMAPVVDAERLAEPLTDATTGIGEQAVDATVDIENGKPVVVPGKEGVGLQPEEMAELLPPVLTKSGDERAIQIEAKVVQPAFTTEDAEKLGITEKISEFTTEYPHAEYRNVNQGRAAAILDGTILKPGETFSFNDTVGERTAANGFTSGSVINGGRFVDELGGGVSQVVTTTYNAGFFAGLQDVEHHPHAFYIDRYPEGREATVYFGSLDLRFKNNLKNGVLIKAFVQKSSPGGVGRTTVQMWGTKEFDVEAGKSERRNTRAPKTRYDDADDCVAQAPLVGFDVDIYRTLSQGGKVVKRETNTAVYQAADRIVCGEEPEPESDEQG